MSEDEVRKLLHEMRDDPIPPDSLVRVRQAVAAAPSASGVRWLGLAAVWKAAVLFALVASIAVVAWRPRVSHPASMTNPSLVAVLRQPVPRPSPTPATPGKPVLRRVKATQHMDTHAAEPSAASVIRIETPDPEVIILLIADGAPARPGDRGGRE